MVDREKIEERRSEVLLELHAKEAFERLYDTMILDEYEHYMESYGEAPDPSDLPTEELKEHHYTCLRILKDWFIEEVEGMDPDDASSHFYALYNDIEKDHRTDYSCDNYDSDESDHDPDNIDIKYLQPCTYKDLRILVDYWEKIEKEETQEEFQKNFEKSLNISEKVNITEAKEASELMMRFMTQDADVVKFMTDMKFDYKNLRKVHSYIHNN